MILHTEFSARKKTNQVMIQIDEVGVKYRVPTEKIQSIKEYAIRRVKGQLEYREFWALQDISLTVKQGEVFGIVGPNGAGKSTLLKVIARVLRPTKGRVQLKGMIAPLLELGAGFDAELTGRENIYLNAGILGFSRAQIEKKFDRIVDFAGLSDFIDAPLRTYSTGMAARLGFAVATDERPDILIVDEILGVGDSEFQTKSYERIQKYSGEGTTILLVSHSLGAVVDICDRVMWLDHGEVQAVGSAASVINKYEDNTSQKQEEQIIEARKEKEEERQEEVRSRLGIAEIRRVRITNEAGEEKAVFAPGDEFHLSLEYHTKSKIEDPEFGIAIHRNDGVHVTGPNTRFAGLEIPSVEGTGVVHYKIASLPLLAGLYHISCAVVSEDGAIMDYHDRAYTFRVTNKSEKIKEQYGLTSLNGTWRHAK